MHEDVKRFSLEGEVAYIYLSQARDSLEDSIKDNMRSSGYVPILDIDPQLSQNYDPERGVFKVKLSLYGAYVGEESVCTTAGMMYGKPIEKSTRKPKLTQS